MEHVPLPTGQQVYPRIPLVVLPSTALYPGMSEVQPAFPTGISVTKHNFRDYRNEQGFEESVLQQHSRDTSTGNFTTARFTQNGARTVDQVESALQEWLTFGLLCEFFGSQYKRSDFVREDADGRKYVVTQKIPELLKTYRSRWNDTHSEERMRFPLVRDCFKFATNFYNGFLGRHGAHQNICPCSEDVTLSIGAILITLTRAGGEIWGEAFFPVTWPAAVDRLLLRNSRCPTTSNMLERMGFGVTGMWYAGMLGPAASIRDHSKCCAESMYCKGNQVRPEAYPETHTIDCATRTTPGSQCRRVSVEASGVESTLRSNDGHPVIAVGDVVPDILSTRNSTSCTRWVAISHVWADGLGSRANDLYECQLRRLQTSVNAVYGNPEDGPVPFWIDTLCVPREPRELRNIAITKLAATYRDASAVLVLDAELFTGTSKAAPYSEILMRIVMSNWMRRLWTLQEGVLPKELHVLCVDGTLDMSNLIERLSSHISESGSDVTRANDDRLPVLYPGQGITTLALQQFKSIRGSGDLARMRDIAPANRFAAVWNNLQWRSTSWVSDETICLAILLDFPRDAMQSLQSHTLPTGFFSLSTDEQEEARKTLAYQRYIRFMELLRDGGASAEVPRGLVFTRGVKMTRKGFRWAPASFFRTATLGTQIHPEPTGTMKADGLHFRAPGVELCLPPNAVAGGRFTLLDEDTKLFYKFNFTLDFLGNRQTWAEVEPGTIKDPAIVLPTSLSAKVNPLENGVGLFVRIVRRETDILHAEILGHVYITRWPENVMNWQVLIRDFGQEVADQIKNGLLRQAWNRRSVMPREETEDQTQWRVDGLALHNKLKGMFASSRLIGDRQIWCIS